MELKKEIYKGHEIQSFSTDTEIGRETAKVWGVAVFKLGCDISITWAGLIHTVEQAKTLIDERTKTW